MLVRFPTFPAFSKRSENALEPAESSATLWDRFAAEGLIAPSHWPLELANILWAGERRGRMTRLRRTAFLELVAGLGVSIDPETASRAFEEIATLAANYTLTVYEAAYLELALRRGVGLVSKDKALLAAAKAAGLETVPV
jgi:predicted nucleic acid-binding protein